MAEAQKFSKKDLDAIDRIKWGLNITEAEATEIYLADKAIDRGERMEFDLPPEQEKEAKKMANVREHKKPTVYKFDKPERKENTLKASLISALFEYIAKNISNNAEITNAERQIAFAKDNENFELTLVQKRKPKGGKGS